MTLQGRSSERPHRRVVLYLLDGERGQPLQYWSFQDRDLVRIGRAAENDVVITHPCVSRAHAYLQDLGNAWRVVAISEQGLITHNKRQMEHNLHHDSVFRLGAGGPYLRFTQGDAGEDQETLIARANEAVVLLIDSQKLQRDVDSVAQGDFFQRLKQTVASLRAHRAAADPSDAPTSLLKSRGGEG